MSLELSNQQQKEIDFSVMGLLKNESDFLNWCFQNRDNLEFLKTSDFINSKSIMVEVYFNDLKTVMEIRKPTVCKRK